MKTWIGIFNSWNHQIGQIAIEYLIVRIIGIVGIIRLLGIRIEYLIVGMIGICGSGYSIVGIIVLGRFMSVWTIANSTKTVMKL